MNPVKATNSAVISLGILTGFVLLSVVSLVISNARQIPIISMSVSFLFFSITLMILLMASRKFGNNEIDSGSRLVKKANIFGFGGLFLLYLSITYLLYNKYPIFSAVFAIVAILSIIYFWNIGKNTFRYW